MGREEGGGGMTTEDGREMGGGKGGKGQGGKLTIVIGIMVAVAIGIRGAVVPGAVMVALIVLR